MRITSGTLDIAAEHSGSGASHIDYRNFDILRARAKEEAERSGRRPEPPREVAAPRHGLRLDALPTAGAAEFGLVRSLLASVFGIEFGAPLASMDRMRKIGTDEDEPAVDADGIPLHRTREYMHQTARFSAGGSVQTADGRSIDFRLDMHVDSESGRELEHIAKGWQEKHDSHGGLLVNLDGESLHLYGTWTSRSSGFIAHDADQDGEITQAEISNTDLRELDSDGNGWIDEGDDAWKDLKFASANGNGEARSLLDVGIGALSVRAAFSPFIVTGRGEYNDAAGRIVSTRLVLREDGRALVAASLDIYA